MEITRLLGKEGIKELECLPALCPTEMRKTKIKGYVWMKKNEGDEMAGGSKIYQAKSA